jgi:branched-chain amino acid transport system substrate-binding protein
MLIGIWTGIIFLSSCSQPEPIIEVGVLYDAHSSQGISLQKVAKQYAAMINKGKGIEFQEYNYQLKIIYQDVGSTPETALAAVYEILKNKNLSAIIGPSSSNQAIPVSHVVEKFKIPLISPASTHSSTTHNKSYVYRAVFTDDVQAKTMSTFVDHLGLSRVAILYDISNSYSKNLTDIFVENLEIKQRQTIWSESYVAGETNFQKYMERIKLANAEVLFLPNFDADLALQLAVIEKMNMEIILLGTDSWNPQNMLPRQISNTVYFSHHWNPILGNSNEEAKEFIKSYSTQYQEQPSILAALSYDSFGLLKEAIMKGGKRPEAIQQSLGQIKKYKGVSGEISFDGTGDPIKSINVYMLNNNKVSVYGDMSDE